MRIQETNQILNEGKLRRLDHERRERQQTDVPGLRERLSGIASKVGRLVRRSDVQAGLSAAGIALVATAGALIQSQRKKRQPWWSFLR